MSAYWTPKTKSSLRQLAIRLEKVQFEEITYGRPAPGNNHTEQYILSRYHELKLANDVAYLACTEEGVKRISAVCLEEGIEGLTVRVASNELPSVETLASLQSIANAISRYADRKIHRDAFLDKSFDMVMQLCGNRIIQRTRPSWAPGPAWLEQKQVNKISLLEKLQDILPQIDKTLQQRFPRTVSALKRVRKQLQHLNYQTRDGKGAREALKIIVLRAYEVSIAEMPRTLEAKLRACGEVGAELAGRNDIRQVDKLARYYGVCKDFGKIARQPGYRDLLSNIVVTRCEGYAVVPSGSGNMRELPVHAEVQLTMHYLACSPSTAPRAMGCSKSACFLCHALITRLGYFSVSACHGRLYSQWTIPDGVHLEGKKAEKLARAILQIRDDLRARIGAPATRICPPESRALSLLSGPSTATQLSLDSASDVSSAETIRPDSAAGPSGSAVPTSHASLLELHKEQQLSGSMARLAGQAAEILTRGSAENRSCQAEVRAAESIRDANLGETDPAVLQSSCDKPAASTRQQQSRRASPIAIVRLKETDLPYERYICNTNMPLLDLQLGHLSLSLDFSSISVGRLVVRRNSSINAELVSFEASQLPTSEPGRMICCRQGNNTLYFQLLCFGRIAVTVEITWGAVLVGG